MAFTPLQQVQVIEQRMALERPNIITRFDDTDGDAIPDVIVTTKEGVEIYRAADLLGGRETRHALEYPPGDWAPFIHLRVRQVYALLGRPAQAREAWKEAAAAGGYVGEAARVLAAKPLVPALAHLHTWQREPDREGPLSLTGPALAPMQVVLQAYLARGGQPDKTDVKAVVLDVQDLIHKDLDGDGQQEVWVRIQGTGYLAVKTRQGWRVGATQSEALPGWDGKLVQYRTPMTKWSAPLLPDPVERCIPRP